MLAERTLDLVAHHPVAAAGLAAVAALLSLLMTRAGDPI
jgi:hypothetical protein